MVKPVEKSPAIRHQPAETTRVEIHTIQPLSENPDPKVLAAEILQVLRYRLGKDTTVATPYDWLTASIKVVRDRIIDHWMTATKEAYERKEKRVYYLSLEFLIGRLMRDAFSNMGLSAVEDLGAVGLVWLATAHPFVAGGLALALVVAILLLVRWVWRALSKLFRGAEQVLAQ